MIDEITVGGVTLDAPKLARALLRVYPGGAFVRGTSDGKVAYVAGRGRFIGSEIVPVELEPGKSQILALFGCALRRNPEGDYVLGISAGSQPIPAGGEAILEAIDSYLEADGNINATAAVAAVAALSAYFHAPRLAIVRVKMPGHDNSASISRYFSAAVKEAKTHPFYRLDQAAALDKAREVATRDLALGVPARNMRQHVALELTLQLADRL